MLLCLSIVLVVVVVVVIFIFFLLFCFVCLSFVVCFWLLLLSSLGFCFSVFVLSIFIGLCFSFKIVFPRFVSLLVLLAVGYFIYLVAVLSQVVFVVLLLFLFVLGFILCPSCGVLFFLCLVFGIDTFSSKLDVVTSLVAKNRSQDKNAFFCCLWYEEAIFSQGTCQDVPQQHKNRGGFKRYVTPSK